MVGKLPPDLLRELVLSRTGARDPAVLVGPGIGEDAAVVDMGGGRVLVAHADPITGAVEYIGRLAVHVASNDVAAEGGQAQVAAAGPPVPGRRRAGPESGT
jgi:Hydrogenase maturation factor